MKHTLSIAISLFGCALAAGAVTPNIIKGKEREAARWADSVYNTLTPRQRIAQLVFPKVNPAQGQTSKTALKRLVETDGCGGLLFSAGTIAEYATMNDYAQSIAKVPLLMTLDGEWGPSMRMKDAPKFQRNMTLGAITDTKLIYRYGQEVARECLALGIDVNFAPDADVNSNPANPVIGDRSFGDDPQRVAKAAVAYALGLEDGGVMAVAKHFPGHGDTGTDSHKTLPTVGHTLQTLEATDLVPFRSFIEAGCSGMMVGHLNVPVLDASGTPASLSAIITGDLLKKRMDFEGLVFTDALGMKGAVPQGENASVEALLAGADVLLCPNAPRTDISAVEAAVKSGKISTKVIEERCKKLLRYKYCLNAGKQCGNPAEVRKIVDSPAARALVDELAAAAITVLWNKNNILPLDNDPKTVVVSLGAADDADFVKTCRFYSDVEAVNAADGLGAAELKKIGQADRVIALVLKDNAAARTAFSSIVAKNNNIVGVFFTSPYKLGKYAAAVKKCAAVMLAYDNTHAARVAAAESLYGGNKVSGRMPVGVPGVADSGTGVDIARTRLGFAPAAAVGLAPWLTDSIDALVYKGLKMGAFPGCQVLVAKDGEIVLDKSYGYISNKKMTKVSNQTVYDLASVSKAVGTLSGFMKLYDSQPDILDKNLGSLIPQIEDSAKKCITVRQLLFHESGMPASLSMYDAMFDSTTFTGKLIRPRRDAAHTIKIQRKAWGNNTAKLRTDILSDHKTPEFDIEIARGIYGGCVTYDTLMRRIYNIPLRKNNNYNYSCLNFSLLMDIEQRLTGKPHQDFVAAEIFAPLGMYRTGYRPKEWAKESTIAPTEYDSFMRRQTVHGFVHDELCAFSGGVQGNAGLFANAGDVAKYCQMLLNGGTYGGRRVLSEATARLFTTEKSPTCRRGLGFDKPDKTNDDYSPTCCEARAEVFGHLGFTGTVFWVDPVDNLIFVFLTNRVNPTRDNAAFSRLNIRPKLFSLVYRALKPAAE